MAGLWGKRKREEQDAVDAEDADLARRARTALVTPTPSMPSPRRRSVTTTSGRCAWTVASASSPVPASPTTVRRSS